MQSQFIYSWHCDITNDGAVPPTLTGEDCTVTSFATSTADISTTTSTTSVSLSAAYNGVNYHDWLFSAMVIVFFVSLMAWPRIFKPIKELFSKKTYQIYDN